MVRYDVGARIEDVQGLLSAARAALGGEEKLKNVQGLMVAGKFRRVMAMRVQTAGAPAAAHGGGEAPPQLTGDVELAFALPDKYVRTNELDTPMGGSITELVGFDGAQPWSDVRTDGGGMVVIRRPQAGAPGASPESGAQRVRAEIARYTLAFLLSAPTAQAVEWSYAGEAEAEDGRADVLDCKGANGFNARLFLDKQTHRPLMLTYRSNEPVMRMEMRNGVPPAGASAGGSVPREARPPADLPAPEMRERETEVRFGDYRTEDGILFPHQLTFARDGEVNEEWEIKTVKVNPQFKPDKFQKQGK
jgi:hypothetical protein